VKPIVKESAKASKSTLKDTKVAEKSTRSTRGRKCQEDEVVEYKEIINMGIISDKDVAMSDDDKVIDVKPSKSKAKESKSK